MDAVDSKVLSSVMKISDLFEIQDLGAVDQTRDVGLSSDGYGRFTLPNRRGLFVIVGIGGLCT